MRWTIAAFMAGAVALAGCQDNEARKQIEELKTENAKLRDGGDPLTKLLAAKMVDGGGTDGTDRKINTLSEDLRAGIETLKREFSATNKRVDDMDERMRKVAALDATITALKATIDSVDGRIKSSSPEEVLKAQKELIQKEAALSQEKTAREAADAKVTQLQGELKAALDTAQQLREEMAGKDSGDISKHPAYVKAMKDLKDERTRNEHLQSDINNLDQRCQRLEQELKAGGKSAVTENPRLDPKLYDFTGTVTQYETATKPGSLGNVIVRMDSGQVPPKDAVLMVLNARAERICNARMQMSFHIDEDPKKAVESIGCQIPQEKAERVPTIGDTVVWIKPAEDKSGKPAEDHTGKPGESKDGSGGGD